jgi:hypothetical protein
MHGDLLAKCDRRQVFRAASSLTAPQSQSVKQVIERQLREWKRYRAASTVVTFAETGVRNSSMNSAVQGVSSDDLQFTCREQLSAVQWRENG